MGALSGAYDGASTRRRSLKEWVTGAGSADADTLWDLPTLRERSRDLVRNSTIASGAINKVTTSVIGSGLKLRAEVDNEALGISKEQAKAFEADAERLWKLWSESVECDAARTLTFAEMQDVVFRSALESGDCFALLPMFSRLGSPFGLKVQLIEADRVSNPDGKADSNTLAGGIAKDKRGAPTSIHIQETHPGDINPKVRKWKQVPMFGSRTGRKNVIHITRKLRPGQTRGVPYLAPIIESIKQISRYTEAEIMAAVVSGMFTVAITTDTGDNILSPFESDGTQETESPEDYKLGNGAMIGLAKGESVETINPGRPNAQFDPFVQAILVQVGMALEIPYEVLINHFGQSFSAAQASLLEAWRFFITRREHQASIFNQPIYDSFIGEQVAAGRLSAPGFFANPLVRKAYTGAKWVGRPKGSIREDIAVKAAVLRLDNNLSTHAQETLEASGNDWDRDEAQRLHETKTMQERKEILAPVMDGGESDKNSDSRDKDSKDGGDNEAT